MAAVKGVGLMAVEIIACPVCGIDQTINKDGRIRRHKAADRTNCQGSGQQTEPGPKFARATDHGRYYEDPSDGQMVISCTNALDEWHIPALPPAAAKETAEYIVDHLPAAVRASLRPDTREAFLKDAKAHYKNVWERKRDLGSRVHRLAEAHVLGKPMPHDDEAAPFIGEYEKWLDRFNVDIDADIELAEVTVLRRSEPRYGGTADLWAHLTFPSDFSRQEPRFQGRNPAPIPTPSGLWLIDIKTSLTKPPSAIYRDNVLQLAALRFADVALLPDDTEIKVPEFAGAAILNLRQDSHGFVPLPAEESAFLAFLSLVGVARFAHALDLKPYKPVVAPLRVVKNEGVA
ncbi:MAG TPA: hypothetical protein VE465_13925 [Streptosporangiaceae bacterium]|nr:hypothetical protein [Streptosporangiaceae bacterium]